MFFAALCGHSSVARAQETFNIDPVTVSPSEVASVKVTVTNPIASSFYTLGIGIANGVSGCQPDPQNPSAAPAGVAGSGPLVLTASPSLDILDTYCVTVLRSPPSPAGVVWTFPQTFSALGSVGTTQSVSPAPGGAGANSNGCLSTATGAYCDIVLLPGVGDSTGKVSLSSCTANGVTTPNGGFGCYVNSIIKLVIGLIGVFSVVMLIVAGVEIMTPGATASEKMTGKARAVNALLGLLVAVGAYVILNTINPNLVNLSITLPSASLVLNPDDPPTTTVTGTTTVSGKPVTFTGALCPQVGGTVSAQIINNGQTQTVNLPISTGEVWPSDSGVNRSFNLPGFGQVTVVGGNQRSRITQAGITINAPEPTVVGSYKDGLHVTSLYGLPESAIEGVINLKSLCNCDLVITGGTECWDHNTHGPGLAPVDLRKTASLIQYVTGSSSDTIGKDYFKGSTDFYDEDSAHFHVRSW